MDRQLQQNTGRQAPPGSGQGFRGRPLSVASAGTSQMQAGDDSDDVADAAPGTSVATAGAIGKTMSDCAWCQYGKPAAVGAVVGFGLAYATGNEVSRGALWGAGGGLLYGYLWG